MSLFGRMTRIFVEATARGVALATEVSGLALRTVGSAVPPELLERLRHALAEPLEALLDLPETVHSTTGLPVPHQAVDTANVMRTLLASGQDASDADLVRRRFTDLLERSTRVDDDAGLPAFLEVVAQLTPDEARLLRWLSDRGPAPVVDLEAVSLIGRGTRRVLTRQTIVADRAGCAAPENVDVYLANLERLGIVEVTDEVLDDHPDHQLVEGTEAYRDHVRRYREDRLWRPRARYRSLRLTRFGAPFLAVCGAPASSTEPLRERRDSTWARGRDTGVTPAT